ncbi:hypothetical protein BGLT_04306 [Caballeronia glathei]|nr:hypothetical protein BGLT_04306 [Caballeronia glathei]
MCRGYQWVWDGIGGSACEGLATGHFNLATACRKYANWDYVNWRRRRTPSPFPKYGRRHDAHFGERARPSVSCSQMQQALSRSIGSRGVPRSSRAVIMAAPIAQLPLTANGRNKHGVQLRHKPIQCQVTAGTVRYDQLAHSAKAFSWPSDQWTRLQYVERAHDIVNSLGRLVRGVLEEKIKNSIEILANLWRQNQSRHFLTFGGTGPLPAARPRRYSRMSVHSIPMPVSSMLANRALPSLRNPRRNSSLATLSAIASNMKLCAVVPDSSASFETRSRRSGGRRSVVVDISTS